MKRMTNVARYRHVSLNSIVPKESFAVLIKKDIRLPPFFIENRRTRRRECSRLSARKTSLHQVTWCFFVWWGRGGILSRSSKRRTVKRDRKVYIYWTNDGRDMVVENAFLNSIERMEKAQRGKLEHIPTIDATHCLLYSRNQRTLSSLFLFFLLLRLSFLYLTFRTYLLR